MSIYNIASITMAVVGVSFLFVLTWQWALAMFGAAASLYFIGMSTADQSGGGGDA